MRLGYEQAVAREERPVIQKGQGESIFKYNGGLFLPANDATERTRGTRVCVVFLNIWHLSLHTVRIVIHTWRAVANALRGDVSLRPAYTLLYYYDRLDAIFTDGNHSSTPGTA